MIHFDIEVPRPLATILTIGAVLCAIAWSADAVTQASVGGDGFENIEVVRGAEEEVRKLRLEQDVLARREQILRAELEALEQEERMTRDPIVQQELRATRSALIALMHDQRAAEQAILASLRQIWEAQGYAIQATRGTRSAGTIELTWPVEPTLGISARFKDDGYEQRFGMPHHAIDIPVIQGSVVASAADGVVVKVTDNGFGFSSIVIDHQNGFATMYGHVSGFLVHEGDDVQAGDPIALSGGRPGTKGAGTMTTGAHLHFELIKEGAQIDPLPYLPAQ